MGKIGYEYGSEWHLLRYLGRHREALNRRILEEVGGESIAWRDAHFHANAPFDAEWKGVEFLPEEHPARSAWVTFWPQTGNVPNWDAVGLLTRNGAREWLLVEAKAHLEEARSSCAAKPKGGLDQIKSTLQAVKAALGVDAARDWLDGYYQYCTATASRSSTFFTHMRSRHAFCSSTSRATNGKETTGGPARAIPVDGQPSYGTWTST